MLGYASLEQNSKGIHLRTKARAFVFASSQDPTQRVVYVSLDTGFMALSAKKLALSYIQSALGDDGKYYSMENILISATHTHAASGGWEDNFLYQVTSLGVVPGQRDAIARGIAQSIINAHNDLKANGAGSSIVFGSGVLANASINRSKPSYINNPASERAKYANDLDLDLVALSVKSSTGKLRGVASWFPVHGVSMNNTNLLISGDNKGFASYLFETDQKAAGNTGFVAAFGQSNAGDVSPNIGGPHCSDTGSACDGSKSSCGGDVTKCVAHGPGYELGLPDTYATEVIGRRQYLKAKDVATNSAATTLGPVLYQHAYVDMSNQQVTLDDGSVGSTCTPSMGFAFSAGTTDGVVSQISFQGDNTTEGISKLLALIPDILATPSAETVACQAPKPILLDTGDYHVPYDWAPRILPLQLFLVGRKFVIIGQPSEITTMAGRRLRDSTLAALVSAGVVDKDARIVIAGLSNSYSSYVTTKEEYQVQRYEGACTIFGPNTLAAYQALYKKLAAGFADKTKGLPAGTPPTDPSSDISVLTPVVLDTGSFGAQVTGPVVTVPTIAEPASTPVNPTATIGRDTVSAVFACAHPRNGAAKDPTTGIENFMSVEKFDSASGTYSTFLTDEGWDTKFRWDRVGVADSHCTVSWTVGRTTSVPKGQYRFHIYGVSKNLFGTLTPYDGVSDYFFAA
ncbi:Neutral/alkaline nonlysosomal ceramidase [Zopfochytrium polystomum]|nr:Neutral/alkaline nonlysosomal ceramidase [Zopfochytrium polystomum]